MNITRSGPPTTHDSRLWRVPLSAPPNRAWQESFQTAEDSTSLASPRHVQFEHAALTFRSGDAHVPQWVESIDRWIVHANTVQSQREDTQRDEAARAQELTDVRRQKARDANERFKNL